MNRRKQYLIPILVLVGVLTLTIGFAAFSSNLVIEPGANVSPDESSFKVVFSKSSTSEEAGNLNPQTGNGATATIDNTNNEKPTISNLKASFVSPGEETTYEFYAYNKGEYKAYLTNIAFNKVSGSELTKTCVAASGTSQTLVDQACEGISIHIDVDGLLADTTMDTSGHSIEKTKSHKVVITMEYDKNAQRADGNFTVTFGDIELTYKSIEGTGTSIGGLTKPENEYICNLESGTSKTTSAMYTCTLDEDRTFYVLGENENDSNKIDLIMDRNYVDDTVPATVNWCANDTDNSCNHDGLDPYISHIQGVFGNSVEVGLPTGKQIATAAGGEESEGTYGGYEMPLPLWLVDNLNLDPDDTNNGYWTSSPEIYFNTSAWFVYSYGLESEKVYNNNVMDLGLRPVITISKDDVE